MKLKSIKKFVPWWLKLGLKVFMARMPIPYAFWKRLEVFEHGDMDNTQRAFETILEHARTADVLDREAAVPQFLTHGNDYAVLEIGPGDSLFTAVIARSLGASQTWLIDSGSFATMHIQTYNELIDYLRQKGLTSKLPARASILMDLLRECRSEYLTAGVHSMAHLPNNSVDFSFSNAVLEHIPKGEFNLLAAELYRVMKPNGVSVHRVDLKDHLGGSLNNCRFASVTWEGDLFRKSGFYTNRIRFGEMLSLFDQAGFDCQIPRVVRWDALPTPRNKLDEAFRRLPDDDLLVSGFDLVLRRKR